MLRLGRTVRISALCAAATFLGAGLSSPIASDALAADVSAPKCWGQDPTIVAIGAESVEGTPGNDVIVASPETYVQAREGNDRVCGSARVAGGRGDDRILFASGTGIPADSMRFPFADGAQGNDQIVFLGALNKDLYILGGDGQDNIRFRGRGTVDGGGKADRIVQTNQGPDGLPDNEPATISGNEGADFVSGGGGQDVLYGSSESHPEGDSKPDVLVGGAGRDVLTGGDTRDRCYQGMMRGQQAQHC